MLSIAVAFRAFFKTLFDKNASERVSSALSSSGPAAIEGPSASKPEPAKPVAPKPEPKMRSDAIAILELLQREARLIDFLMESLDDYSDDQIGVAVRDVHRGSREVLDRIFELQPIVTEEEGEACEVPADYSATEYRVIGQLEGDPPYQGELLHHGWRASHVKLPKWSGSEEGHHVVAPVEVEVRSS